MGRMGEMGRGVGGGEKSGRSNDEVSRQLVLLLHLPHQLQTPLQSAFACGHLGVGLGVGEEIGIK